MDLIIRRTVPVQDWMVDAALGKIFSLLPQVLCVGGCVRNTLLGRMVEDVDLATPLSPQEVTQKLEAAGVRVVPTGIDHGTVTAVIDHRPFEITTLRRDVETDGRHATVSFTEDWKQDAQRRDFTVNTLLMDLQGNVFDPTGEGLADLDKGVIRFVGVPEDRIKEDYLRILRFFRFHALYGKGEMDMAALEACRVQAQNIPLLSRERISQEFFKIIASDKPQDVLRAMFDHGVLRDFCFPEYDAELFGHFVMCQSRFTLISVPSRILMFAGMSMSNVKAMERLILFPKVFLKDMSAILGALNLSDLSCDTAVRESMYRFGKGITAQVLMMELAMDRVMNGYAPQALRIIQTWDVPDFPVSGSDLMALGILQGPELGQTLQRLEDWWIAQDFKPSKAQILEQQ